MISFTDARQIAAARYLTEDPEDPPMFEPAVSSEGMESDQFFLVIVGPREWIVNGVEGIAPVDDLIRLVDKRTGEYSTRYAPTFLEELAKFRPVSDI